MIGVTIRDTDERNGHRFLNFDVATILSLIEDKLRDSVWKCSELDCLGENAKTIHDIADQNESSRGTSFSKSCRVFIKPSTVNSKVI